MPSIQTSLRFLLAPSCLVATPALAEVCDKARSGWDGDPVGMFGELGHFLLSYLGAFIVVVVVAGLAIRKTWLLAAATILNLGLACVYVAEWLAPFEIRAAAIAEGCIGSPALLVSLVIITGLGLWGLAIHSRKLTSAA